MHEPHQGPHSPKPHDQPSLSEPNSEGLADRIEAGHLKDKDLAREHEKFDPGGKDEWLDVYRVIYNQAMKGRRSTRSPHQGVEDHIQDSFLSVKKVLDKAGAHFDGVLVKYDAALRSAFPNLRGYLATICANAFKKEPTGVKFEAPPKDQSLENIAPSSASSDPAHQAELKDLVSKVQGIIQAVPIKRHRCMLTERFINGESIKDAANLAGMSYTAATSATSAFRKRLSVDCSICT